jgi:hypothetical protein
VPKAPKEKKKKSILDCGRPVNETQYDHLSGIAARHTHPHIPEPEVAEIFKKRGRHSSSNELDMTLLEKALHKDKKEVCPIVHSMFDEAFFFYLIIFLISEAEICSGLQ